MIEALVALDKCKGALVALPDPVSDMLENDVILFWQIAQRMHKKISNSLWEADVSSPNAIEKALCDYKPKKRARPADEPLTQANPTQTEEKK